MALQSECIRFIEVRRKNNMLFCTATFLLLNNFKKWMLLLSSMLPDVEVVSISKLKFHVSNPTIDTNL
jgi:hypothetical protein